MTVLSFIPAPGANRLSRMVAAHARMEVLLLARNGEQLLLALGIPLLLLVGGAKSGTVVDLGSGRRIDVLTPGVLALAVMSTAFTSLAIATAFERRYGVLKRLGASPLPREGLLLAKIAALLCIETVQLGVISAAGLALGWHPHGGFATVASCLVLVVTGTAAFASLGLFLAGTLRAEATLAAANLVYVLLLVVGAVVVPLASYPESLQPAVSVLPSAALAEGLRDVCSGAGLESWRVAALVGWAVLAGTLTTRTFRWE